MPPEKRRQQVVEELEEDPIVLELGMTKSQLESLRWVLICWLGQYESGEGSQLKSDVLAIHEALESV